MGTAERLKEYLEYKKIAVFKAENDCGLSSSSLSKALPNPSKGIEGKSIGSDNLEKILSTYTDLSADWLLRGSGTMLIGGGSKAVELENKIASMSEGRPNKDAAYDVILSMVDMVSKTYEFFGKKGE